MIYFFLADGFEDAEAIVPFDLLKRAGAAVKTVGITGDKAVSSRGIEMRTDISPKKVSLTDCDGVFLPGGMPGTENLYKSRFVRDAVQYCFDNGKLICAICAAPSVLGRMGLLNGKTAVCYPGFEKLLDGCKIGNGPVCRDSNIITARGAGCVFPFSKEIITYLFGSEKAESVLSEIQYSDLDK